MFSVHHSITMQQTLKVHMECETKIQDDSIELWKAIKILMCDPIGAKHSFASLTEATSGALNVRQQQNEGPLDCMKKLKQAKDVMMSHIGKTC